MDFTLPGMRRNLWLPVALLLTVVSGGAYLLTAQNDSPAFTIDRTKPYSLEFGRGSGWHGLNTIKLDSTGQVTLHRIKQSLSWETTSYHLSQESLTEVLNAVETNNLLGLRKAYHENIRDGTQWVLWIKQGEQEKSVYFDNNFPQRIKTFAKELDAILTRTGSNNAVWQPVPAQESRQHERALWDSIKR